MYSKTPYFLTLMAKNQFFLVRLSYLCGQKCINATVYIIHNEEVYESEKL